MAIAMEWLALLLPWAAVVGLCAIGFRLVVQAKARKTAAFVIGAFLQMILPDPYAERTIEVVQDRKKEVVRKQDENGEPPNNPRANG